ncbi:hypothetical protein [Nonlabens sp.]|uniref:hypothetical protein n=1 Tax=Nonlabens sp. TaxID=1888209 RepID=UPI0025F3FCDB|nr:hypothetical protein [Nonlabens sp.]
MTTKSKSRQGIHNIAKAVASAFIFAMAYAFYDNEALTNWLRNTPMLIFFSSFFNISLLMDSWTFIQKLVPLLLLVMWLFASKLWWYYAIVLPIRLCASQLCNLFYFSRTYNDIGEWRSIELVDIFLSLCYQAKIKIFDQIHSSDICEMEDGIKNLGIAGSNN